MNPLFLILAGLMVTKKKKKPSSGVLPPTTPPRLTKKKKSSTSGYQGIPRAEMQEIQVMLMANGYGVGEKGLDGRWGPATKTAVEEFQEDWGGLQVDGKPGPMTRAALEEAEKQRRLAAGMQNQCDPLDPKTWGGSGYVCVFDGTRWAKVSKGMPFDPYQWKTWSKLKGWLPENMRIDFGRGKNKWGPLIKQVGYAGSDFKFDENKWGNISFYMAVGGEGGKKKVPVGYIKNWIEAIRDAATKNPGSYFLVEMDYRWLIDDEVLMSLGYGKHGTPATGGKWNWSKSKIASDLKSRRHRGYEEWADIW